MNQAYFCREPGAGHKCWLLRIVLQYVAHMQIVSILPGFYDFFAARPSGLHAFMIHGDLYADGCMVQTDISGMFLRFLFGEIIKAQPQIGFFGFICHHMDLHDIAHWQVMLVSRYKPGKILPG